MEKLKKFHPEVLARAKEVGAIPCPEKFHFNLLRGTTAYTIGNLQYSSFKFAKQWRDELKEKLDPIGVKVLSPLDKVFKNYEAEGSDKNKELIAALQKGKFDYVHEEALKIRSRDLRLVDHAVFLVAVLDVTKPSVGSIDEIITAKRAAKPVFLVIPNSGYKQIPIWLASYFKPQWVYKNLDEVVEILFAIDEGKEEINSKYWKIPNF